MNELLALRIAKITDLIKTYVEDMSKANKVTSGDLLFIQRLMGALDENIRLIDETEE